MSTRSASSTLAVALGLAIIAIAALLLQLGGERRDDPPLEGSEAGGGQPELSLVGLGKSDETEAERTAVPGGRAGGTEYAQSPTAGDGVVRIRGVVLGRPDSALRMNVTATPAGHVEAAATIPVDATGAFELEVPFPSLRLVGVSRLVIEALAEDHLRRSAPVALDRVRPGRTYFVPLHLIETRSVRIVTWTEDGVVTPGADVMLFRTGPGSAGASGARSGLAVPGAQIVETGSDGSALLALHLGTYWMSARRSRDAAWSRPRRVSIPEDVGHDGALRPFVVPDSGEHVTVRVTDLSGAPLPGAWVALPQSHVWLCFESAGRLDAARPIGASLLTEPECEVFFYCDGAGLVRLPRLGDEARTVDLAVGSPLHVRAGVVVNTLKHEYEVRLHERPRTHVRVHPTGGAWDQTALPELHWSAEHRGRSPQPPPGGSAAAILDFVLGEVVLERVEGDPLARIVRPCDWSPCLVSAAFEGGAGAEIELPSAGATRGFGGVVHLDVPLAQLITLRIVPADGVRRTLHVPVELHVVGITPPGDASARVTMLARWSVRSTDDTLELAPGTSFERIAVQPATMSDAVGIVGGTFDVCPQEPTTIDIDFLDGRAVPVRFTVNCAVGSRAHRLSEATVVLSPRTSIRSAHEQGGQEPGARVFKIRSQPSPPILIVPGAYACEVEIQDITLHAPDVHIPADGSVDMVEIEAKLE